METTTERNEIKSPPHVTIRGDIEKIKRFSVQAASITAQSGFEPVGIVSTRIVGKLMANLKKDAA